MFFPSFCTFSAFSSVVSRVIEFIRIIVIFSLIACNLVNRNNNNNNPGIFFPAVADAASTPLVQNTCTGGQFILDGFSDTTKYLDIQSMTACEVTLRNIVVDFITFNTDFLSVTISNVKCTATMYRCIQFAQSLNSGVDSILIEDVRLAPGFQINGSPSNVAFHFIYFGNTVANFAKTLTIRRCSIQDGTVVTTGNSDWIGIVYFNSAVSLMREMRFESLNVQNVSLQGTGGASAVVVRILTFDAVVSGVRKMVLDDFALKNLTLRSTNAAVLVSMVNALANVFGDNFVSLDGSQEDCSFNASNFVMDLNNNPIVRGSSSTAELLLVNFNGEFRSFPRVSFANLSMSNCDLGSSNGAANVRGISLNNAVYSLNSALGSPNYYRTSFTIDGLRFSNLRAVVTSNNAYVLGATFQSEFRLYHRVSISNINLDSISGDASQSMTIRGVHCGPTFNGTNLGGSTLTVSNVTLSNCYVAASAVAVDDATVSVYGFMAKTIYNFNSIVARNVSVSNVEIYGRSGITGACMAFVSYVGILGIFDFDSMTLTMLNNTAVVENIIVRNVTIHATGSASTGAFGAIGTMSYFNTLSIRGISADQVKFADSTMNANTKVVTVLALGGYITGSNSSSSSFSISDVTLSRSSSCCTNGATSFSAIGFVYGASAFNKIEIESIAVSSVSLQSGTGAVKLFAISVSTGRALTGISSLPINDFSSTISVKNVTVRDAFDMRSTFASVTVGGFYADSVGVNDFYNLTFFNFEIANIQANGMTGVSVYGVHANTVRGTNHFDGSIFKVQNVMMRNAEVSASTGTVEMFLVSLQLDPSGFNIVIVDNVTQQSVYGFVATNSAALSVNFRALRVFGTSSAPPTDDGSKTSDQLTNSTLSVTNFLHRNLTGKSILGQVSIRLVRSDATFSNMQKSRFENFTSDTITFIGRPSPALVAQIYGPGLGNRTELSIKNCSVSNVFINSTTSNGLAFDVEMNLFFIASGTANGLVQQYKTVIVDSISVRSVVMIASNGSATLRIVSLWDTAAFAGSAIVAQVRHEPTTLSITNIATSDVALASMLSNRFVAVIGVYANQSVQGFSNVLIDNISFENHIQIFEDQNADFAIVSTGESQIDHVHVSAVNFSGAVSGTGTADSAISIKNLRVQGVIAIPWDYFDFSGSTANSVGNKINNAATNWYQNLAVPTTIKEIFVVGVLFVDAMSEYNNFTVDNVTITGTRILSNAGVASVRGVWMDKAVQPPQVFSSWTWANSSFVVSNILISNSSIKSSLSNAYVFGLFQNTGGVNGFVLVSIINLVIDQIVRVASTTSSILVASYSNNAGMTGPNTYFAGAAEATRSTLTLRGCVVATTSIVASTSSSISNFFVQSGLTGFESVVFDNLSIVSSSGLISGSIPLASIRNVEIKTGGISSVTAEEPPTSRRVPSFVAQHFVIGNDTSVNCTNGSALVVNFLINSGGDFTGFHSVLMNDFAISGGANSITTAGDAGSVQLINFNGRGNVVGHNKFITGAIAPSFVAQNFTIKDVNATTNTGFIALVNILFLRSLRNFSSVIFDSMEIADTVTVSFGNFVHAINVVAMSELVGKYYSSDSSNISALQSNLTISNIAQRNLSLKASGTDNGDVASTGFVASSIVTNFSTIALSDVSFESLNLYSELSTIIVTAANFTSAVNSSSFGQSFGDVFGNAATSVATKQDLLLRVLPTTSSFTFDRSSMTDIRIRSGVNSGSIVHLTLLDAVAHFSRIRFSEVHVTGVIFVNGSVGNFHCRSLRVIRTLAPLPQSEIDLLGFNLAAPLYLTPSSIVAQNFTITNVVAFADGSTIRIEPVRFFSFLLYFNSVTMHNILLQNISTRALSVFLLPVFVVGSIEGLNYSTSARLSIDGIRIINVTSDASAFASAVPVTVQSTVVNFAGVTLANLSVVDVIFPSNATSNIQIQALQVAGTISVTPQSPAVLGNTFLTIKHMMISGIQRLDGYQAKIITVALSTVSNFNTVLIQDCVVQNLGIITTYSGTLQLSSVVAADFLIGALLLNSSLKILDCVLSGSSRSEISSPPSMTVGSLLLSASILNFDSILINNISVSYFDKIQSRTSNLDLAAAVISNDVTGVDSSHSSLTMSNIRVVNHVHTIGVGSNSRLNAIWIMGGVLNNFNVTTISNVELGNDVALNAQNAAASVAAVEYSFDAGSSLKFASFVNIRVHSSVMVESREEINLRAIEVGTALPGIATFNVTNANIYGNVTCRINNAASPFLAASISVDAVRLTAVMASNGQTTSIFVVKNASAKDLHLSATSNSNNNTDFGVRAIQISQTIMNFGSVVISDVAVESSTLVHGSTGVAVQGLRLTNIQLFGQNTPDFSQLLSIARVRIFNVTISNALGSPGAMSVVSVSSSAAISRFYTVSITDVSIDTASLNNSDGQTSAIGIYIDNSLAGTDTPSSTLVVSNVVLRQVSQFAPATSSYFFGFYQLEGSIITAFNEATMTNISIVGGCSASAGTSVDVKSVYLHGTNFNGVASGSSKFVVQGIKVHDLVEVSASQIFVYGIVLYGGSITNFERVSFSDIDFYRISNVTAASSVQFSGVYLVGDVLPGPDEFTIPSSLPPTSAITMSGIHMTNFTNISAGVYVLLYSTWSSPGLKILSFHSIRFSDITVSSVRVFANSSTIRILLTMFEVTVNAFVDSALQVNYPSSTTVEHFLINDVTAFGAGGCDIQAYRGFYTVTTDQFIARNISVLNSRFNAGTGAATTRLIYFTQNLVSTAATVTFYYPTATPRRFINVSGLFMNQVEASGAGQNLIELMFCNRHIYGFDAVWIADFGVDSVRLMQGTGAGWITGFSLSGFVNPTTSQAPTESRIFRMNNFVINNSTISGSGDVTIALAMFFNRVRGYNQFIFYNMSATSNTIQSSSTSTVSSAVLQGVTTIAYFAASISSSSSSLSFELITLARNMLSISSGTVSMFGVQILDPQNFVNISFTKITVAADQTTSVFGDTVYVQAVSTRFGNNMSSTSNIIVADCSIDTSKLSVFTSQISSLLISNIFSVLASTTTTTQADFPISPSTMFKVENNVFSSPSLAPTSTALAKCSASSCGMIHLDPGTFLLGNWTLSNNSIFKGQNSMVSLGDATSISALQGENTKFYMQGNTIRGGGGDCQNSIVYCGQVDVVGYLNKSTWTFGCNHWTRNFEYQFRDSYFGFQQVGSSAIDSWANYSFLCPRSKSATFATRSRSAPSATRTESLTIIALPPAAPTTTFATTLVSFKGYSPIPSGLTQFPSFTPPPTTATTILGAPLPPITLADIDGKDSMEAIRFVLERVSGAVMPVTMVIRAADPTLGTFISIPKNVPRTVDASVNSVGDKITFVATNLTDLAIALTNVYAYSVSPEAAARNLTEGQYVNIVATDAAPSISTQQRGETAVAIKKVVINRGPRPQYKKSQNVTFNVTRGKKFLIDIGSVFVHEQGLNMYFGFQQQDLFPLPTSIRVVCVPFGNCTVRGILDPPDVIPIEAQASDGYILAAAYFTIVPVVEPIHPDNSVVLPAVRLRPGVQFQYAIPTNLFVSSTEITYTAVRLANGDLLPPTMAFDSPNILRGSYNSDGLLQVQVRATDYFFDSARNFTLNFTNAAPYCRRDFTTIDDASTTTSTAPSPSSPQQQTGNETTSAPSSSPPNNIVPATCFQSFDREVEFSKVCYDGDGDPLQYSIKDYDLPSWMKAIIIPGGVSTLPQTIRISGTPPASAQGTTFFINVTVSDTFSNFILALPLRVATNYPPVLIRPLQNYSIHPGDVAYWTVDLNQYFADPNGDTMTAQVTILTDYARTWLTVNTDAGNFVYLAARPPDEAAGAADDAHESTEYIRVRMIDPFGKYVDATIEIDITFTLWQKVKTLVYILVGLCSTLASVVSAILLYPYFINFFRAGSRTIPCPLDAKHRLYNLPADAAEVRITDRTDNDYCMPIRNFTRHISVWLYDQATLENFPHGTPPGWVITVDKGLKVGNILRKPGTVPEANIVDPGPVYDYCYVRIFNRRNIILVQFAMEYAKITKGWDFDEVEREETAEKLMKAQEEARKLANQKHHQQTSPSQNVSPTNNNGVEVDIDLMNILDDNNNNDDFNADGDFTPKNNNNSYNPMLDVTNGASPYSSRNNNSNTNNMERRMQDLDTRLISIDLHNESKDEEMRAMKNESERKLKMELEKRDQEIRNLNDIVQRLISGNNNNLSGNSSKKPIGKTNLNSFESQLNHNGNNNNADDDDDDVERLEKFSSQQRGGIYKAKGEYDRELELLLDADTNKASKTNKARNSGTGNAGEKNRSELSTTFNPIHRLRAGSVANNNNTKNNKNQDYVPPPPPPPLEDDDSIPPPPPPMF